ncbi:MAG: glycosyltransferase [Pirellulales bacterium]|nr:glycosyltransferase [Pirellulales bacterium]
MKVALVAGSVSRRGAGVAIALRELATALIEVSAVGVTALSLEDEYSNQDLPLWAPVRPQTVRTIGPRSVGYAPELARRLSAADADVVHGHGLWQWQSAAVHAWSRRFGRPYLVSPHGMLDPWALKNSRWKKRIALAMYERRHLRDAVCLHALCESERQSFRRFGLTNPVAVIPNGVALPARTAKFDEGPRRLVFLGRLHPKKGLKELINAWAPLAAEGQREWRLVIAGWDDGGHEEGLRKRAAELGVDGSIAFAGPVFGDAKEELLAGASAFVLPSYSEGLPMAVLEAWSYGLPVVMTDACNLPEGFASEAALRVAPETASIATGLRELMRMSTAELRAMGARGRRLVEQKFSWPEIARQMAEVYRWVLGGGAAPACVETA